MHTTSMFYVLGLLTPHTTLLLFDPGLGPALAELNTFSAYTVIHLPKHSYPRYICTYSNTNTYPYKVRHIQTHFDTLKHINTHCTHVNCFILHLNAAEKLLQRQFHF